MAKDMEIRKTGGQLQQPTDAFSDMDRMIERFLSEPFSSFFNRPTQTRRFVSEVKESNDAYIMRTEIPGIPKEDINVEVNGNVLTVRAAHDETKDGKSEWTQEYRSFQQTYTLPSTVDAAGIKAHCENGMLEILLPKTASAQPKKVEVQTGKGGFWSRLAGKSEEAEGSVAKSKNH